MDDTNSVTKDEIYDNIGLHLGLTKEEIDILPRPDDELCPVDLRCANKEVIMFYVRLLHAQPKKLLVIGSFRNNYYKEFSDSGKKLFDMYEQTFLNPIFKDWLRFGGEEKFEESIIKLKDYLRDC